jgi:predicted SprT family Zn-dependent metalloprotease
MSFPKSFDIMGNTIKIKYYKKLKDLGQFHPEKGLIKILKHDGISYDQVMTTIYHELAHVIMYNMNIENLYKDEQFIDILGNLIYQFDKTKKY